MGSSSFHVEGRGHEAALCSSPHGAGRALSRAAARAKVTDREFRRQMQGVWYDYRLSDKLRDEAPAAYKDIDRVMADQADLVYKTEEGKFAALIEDVRERHNEEQPVLLTNNTTIPSSSSAMKPCW